MPRSRQVITETARMSVSREEAAPGSRRVRLARWGHSNSWQRIGRRKIAHCVGHGGLREFSGGEVEAPQAELLR